MSGNPIEPKDTFHPSIGNGITIRQYFAAQAMQGLCAGTNSHFQPEMYAEYSVKYADALIAELNKPTKQ